MQETRRIPTVVLVALAAVVAVVLLVHLRHSGPGPPSRYAARPALTPGVLNPDVTQATIQGNNIHDVRTSPIVGGNLDHVVIDSNHLANSHPWGSDHADLIHIWTDPTHQTTASTDFQITGNVLDSGNGVPPLGIYFDDNGNNLGFSHVTIANNVILDAVGQGMRPRARREPRGARRVRRRPGR